MPSTTPPPKPISIEMISEHNYANRQEEFYNLNMYSNYNTHIFSLYKTPSSHVLKKHLDELRAIEQNWDRAGGLTISKIILEITSNLFEKLPNILISNLETDDISPNSNGTISVEWIKDSSNKLFLEIGETSSSYFVKKSGDDPKFVNDLQLSDTQIPSSLINDLKLLML